MSPHEREPDNPYAAPIEEASAADAEVATSERSLVVEGRVRAIHAVAATAERSLVVEGRVGAIAVDLFVRGTMALLFAASLTRALLGSMELRGGALLRNPLHRAWLVTIALMVCSAGAAFVTRHRLRRLREGAASWLAGCIALKIASSFYLFVHMGSPPLAWLVVTGADIALCVIMHDYVARRGGAAVLTAEYRERIGATPRTTARPSIGLSLLLGALELSIVVATVVIVFSRGRS